MSKKSLVLSAVLITLTLFIWFISRDPARNLTNTQIKEVGIYSLKFKPSLRDLGYTQKTITAVKGLSDNSNGIFNETSKKKIENALIEISSSYYTFNHPRDEEKLYALNIKFSKDEGYTLVTTNLEDEANGKFYGYKYHGRLVDKREIKWFVYNNPKLGHILEELRK